MLRAIVRVGILGCLVALAACESSPIYFSSDAEICRSRGYSEGTLAYGDCMRMRRHGRATPYRKI